MTHLVVISGLYKPETKVEEKKERPAAHVIGKISINVRLDFKCSLVHSA